MIIVGNDINQQYLEQLIPKVQSLIDRKVSFHLQAAAWIGKGIVLYNKIEKEVNDNEKKSSWVLDKEEFAIEDVMEK